MSKQELMIHMVKAIRQPDSPVIQVMEVCGTHTQAFSKFGIRQLVKPNIRLLSGPGCPVCVTSQTYIDGAIELLQKPNMIITTFGDMMKVKGSKSNLTQQREEGKHIRVVYSPLDTIKIAKENKEKQVVFLAVGFETTAPLVALAIKRIQEDQIENISFLLGLKTMEPILHHILSDKQHNIQGFICPGHVAAVKGAKYFKFIVEQYNIPAVIAGFEELDIVAAVFYLQKQQSETTKSFCNLYKSCVSPEGNRKANGLMKEIFTSSNEEWRGIGTIEQSGIALVEKYKKYDATTRFGVTFQKSIITTCICSDILLGKRTPDQCEFFGKSCTPSRPVGPCMISTEGACSVFYKDRN